MKQNYKPLLKCRLPGTKTEEIFRELNNVTLAELPSKLIWQTFVLTRSLRV